MIQQFDSLLSMMDAFPDEQACIDHLRTMRWKDGAFCPYCAGRRIYDFKDGRTHKCADCRQRFSIKVGTIFEDTKLPLRKWFAAIWLITSHRKGISSLQLHRDLKITQKSAWFVLHRLRHAARTKSFNRPLDGQVEADETFMGGKEKNKHEDKRPPGSQGGAGKVAEMELLERGGELRAGKVERLTDEAKGYRGLGGDYNHHTVNHSTGGYVRHYFIHTNGLENAWSLFKRQVFGIHHWISAKHLDRYLSEFTFRYNRRKAAEGDRVNTLLASIEGRLTYKA